MERIDYILGDELATGTTLRAMVDDHVAGASTISDMDRLVRTWGARTLTVQGPAAQLEVFARAVGAKPTPVWSLGDRLWKVGAYGAWMVDDDLLACALLAPWIISRDEIAERAKE